MNIVKNFIALAIIIIVSVAVVFPILSQVTTEANIHSLPDSVKTLVQILPVVVAIAIIVSIVGLFSFGEYEETDVELDEEGEVDEEPPLKQLKKARKSAYEILAERYARGEISDEEYTEKMCRL
jgi:uncharacterized membrane protein